MKRLIAILLFLPATAFAQDSTVSEGIVFTPPAAHGRSATSTFGAAPVQAGPAQPELRRRPSMVGYIGNAAIESSVRIRFDAGYGAGTPDRAEFFYAKCGCYRTLPSNLPVFDPNAAGPGPGVLTNLNFQQLYLLGEYAPMPRVSLFAELPIRFLQPQSFAAGTGSFASASGVSDLRIGVKAGFVSTPMAQVTGSLQFSTPTGDARKGLGTDHGSVEPVLLFEGHPTDRLGIEAQFGDIIPIGGSAGLPTNNTKKFSGNVLYYGIGPSFEVARKGEMAFVPVLELVGWHVVNGFQTSTVAPADASGTNIVNLKLGTRILFNERGSVYIGYGHALTEEWWYRNILRLEYRVGL